MASAVERLGDATSLWYTNRSWDAVAATPVDWLTTTASLTAPAIGAPQFPSERTTGDTVVTAYVNLAEVSTADWDPATEPHWDLDGDGLIDPSVGADELPSWLDPDVRNPEWLNYVVRYWDPAWHTVIKSYVDSVAAQGLDGVTFDVMTAHWTWAEQDPDARPDFVADMATLVRTIGDYIDETYGDAFAMTVNVSPIVLTQHPDLVDVIDGLFIENAVFRWNGDGTVENGGLSEIDDLAPFRESGTPIFAVDHLGFGFSQSDFAFLDDGQGNDAANAENFELLFRSGITYGFKPSATSLSFEADIPPFPRYQFGHPVGETLQGYAHADYIYGDAGDDRLNGNDGGDLLAGGPGRDILDGGAGLDRALFVGPRRLYEVGPQTSEGREVEQGSVASTVVVTASGSAALGEGASYQLLVNGLSAGAPQHLSPPNVPDHFDGPRETTTFEIDGAVEHVAVRFLNDIFISEDQNRDLLIWDLRVNGIAVELGEAAYGGPSGDEPFVVFEAGVNLFEEGELRWSVPSDGMTADADGSDRLIAIERLDFSDGTLAFDPSAERAYRLYRAAFDREPDPEGLGHWVSRIDAGMAFTDVAQAFIASAEFKSLYGDAPSNDGFLLGIYENVLNRPPDNTGLAYWRAQIDQAGQSRAEILARFADSPENRSLTSDQVDDGVWFT